MYVINWIHRRRQ